MNKTLEREAIAADIINKVAQRAAEVLAAANSSYGTAIALMGADIKNIKDGMARMEKVLESSVNIKDWNEHLKADADHEVRIRTLEKAMWKYIGIASATTAFLVFVGNYLIGKLH